MAQMRYLDLEHELDHLAQIWERFYYLGFLLYTSLSKDGRVVSTPSHESDNALTTWQNAIMEYHVRLQEVQRLHQRQVESTLLHEHYAQLEYWSDVFWKKGLGMGQSQSKRQWQQRHFPDIFDLRHQVQLLMKAELATESEL